MQGNMDSSESKSVRTEIVNAVHRVIEFFQKNWRGFCAWANETAKACHRYFDEQNGRCIRWQQDVHVPRLTRIIEARNAAARQGKKERVVSLDQKLQAYEDKVILRMEHVSRACEKRFTKRGWVRRDPGLAGYGFFGLPHGSFWVPLDFVNPVRLVFGFGRASRETRLPCDCALLAVLHDFTVEESEPHICCDPRVDDREPWHFECGDPFDREKRTGFVWAIRDGLDVMVANGKLYRAWDRVKAELEKLHGKADTPAPTSPAEAGTPKAEGRVQAELAKPGRGETNGPDPWIVTRDDSNTDYMPASEARSTLANGKPSAPALSKKLGTIPVHYMRTAGKGCRVHIGEFRTWAQQQGFCLGDTDHDKIATEYMADIAARKAAAQHKKRHQQ
jgi:hypothetical protein